MAEPTDSYESKYMEREGAILAREKIVARTGTLVALAIAAGLAVAAPVLFFALPGLGPVALLPLIPSAILALASTVFGVLRTIVTREHVHVQLGYHGPRIPIAAIEGVAIAASPRPNAWGVRFAGPGYWTYTTSLPRGLAIAWRDEKGGQKRIFVSSLEPERIRDAIEKARAGAAPPAVQVRVAEMPGPEESAEEAPASHAEVEQKRRAE